ncbi:MAG TPA: hypothetical protein VFB32_10725, partial [Rudaea sp.]|nr:hypothetical protein [Rudaea sp.]
MRAWLSEVAIRCCAVALSYATLGHAADLGMRFDTPGVLDLSDRSLTIANGMPVPARELTADDADAIFAAPVQHEMSAL